MQHLYSTPKHYQADHKHIPSALFKQTKQPRLFLAHLTGGDDVTMMTLCYQES